MKTHSRSTIDEYFLNMAKLVSSRSTCLRRNVGCILVDCNNYVLATGYNGVARGEPHCLDHACPGAALPSGVGLDVCEAIHAEQNAILQCKNVKDVMAAYITVSPCPSCAKLLMNTSCQKIVFIEEYKDLAAQKLWKGEWIHHGPVKPILTQKRLEAT